MGGHALLQGNLSSKNCGSPASQADSLPFELPGNPKLPPHLSIPLQCLLEASVTYWVLAFGDLSNYSVLLFSRHGLLYLYFPTDPITMLAQFSKE